MELRFKNCIFSHFTFPSENDAVCLHSHPRGIYFPGGLKFAGGGQTRRQQHFGID